jgi:hypothetical protein
LIAKTQSFGGQNTPLPSKHSFFPLTGLRWQDYFESGGEKVLSFRECTLTKLEKTFEIEQVWNCSILDQWLMGSADISEFERCMLLKFRENAILTGYDWNETELEMKFIGPLLTLVDYASEQFNFFAEREFRGVVDDIEMKGKPDGMIASGLREPEQPYFCFQEYKKTKDPEGDPAAQALAAMLVAQELNEHRHPVYGAYIIGRDWCFMTLQEKQYAMSEPYIATRDDLFDIFRILKVLKQVIIEWVQTP